MLKINYEIYFDCDEIFQRLGHFTSFYGQMSSMKKVMDPLTNTIMSL